MSTNYLTLENATKATKNAIKAANSADTTTSNSGTNERELFINQIRANNGLAKPGNIPPKASPYTSAYTPEEKKYLFDILKEDEHITTLITGEMDAGDWALLQKALLNNKKMISLHITVPKFSLLSNIFDWNHRTGLQPIRELIHSRTDTLKSLHLVLNNMIYEGCLPSILPWSTHETRKPALTSLHISYSDTIYDCSYNTMFHYKIQACTLGCRLYELQLSSISFPFFVAPCFTNYASVILSTDKNELHVYPIQSLKLYDCGVYPANDITTHKWAGAEAFADALKNNTTLTEFSCVTTNGTVDQYTCDCITAALKENQTLTKIEFDNPYMRQNPQFSAFAEVCKKNAAKNPTDSSMAKATTATTVAIPASLISTSTQPASCPAMDLKTECDKGTKENATVVGVATSCADTAASNSTLIKRAKPLSLSGIYFSIDAPIASNAPQKPTIPVTAQPNQTNASSNHFGKDN